MSMPLLHNEKGASLIMAVAVLMLLSFMALTMVSVVGKESYSVVHHAQSIEAFALAEAGTHRALTFLSREEGSCTEITGVDFTDVPLGRGTFTVTATQYASSTTLTGGIDATSTTIRVEDLTGFAPRGRISIESEFIDYTGIGTSEAQCGGDTPPCFTGGRRGADGTTAAAHDAGTPVSQYKCTMVSTGSIPGPAGDSKRVVEVTVQ